MIIKQVKYFLEVINILLFFFCFVFVFCFFKYSMYSRNCFTLKTFLQVIKQQKFIKIDEFFKAVQWKHLEWKKVSSCKTVYGLVFRNTANHSTKFKFWAIIISNFCYTLTISTSQFYFGTFFKLPHNSNPSFIRDLTIQLTNISQSVW